MNANPLTVRCAGLLAIAVAAPSATAEPGCPLCELDRSAAVVDASASPGDAGAPDDNASILGRAEAAASALDTLEARLGYKSVQGLLGDEQTRFGTIVYDAGGEGRPPRFVVALDRLLVDGRPREIDKRYVFDGRWLAEVDADERTFTRRELVAPGERARFLEMGEGPFALPLNMDARVVRERFEAIEVDDAERPLVRLRPREGFDLDADEIVIEYDPTTMLPSKATTHEDVEVGDRSDVWLMETKTGVAIAADAFDTTPPDDPAWRVQVVRLAGGPADAAAPGTPGAPGE